MGERICAPSIPLFFEPNTRLSRVVPQEDCLMTCTSDMPYFLKKLFSSASNKGAASVNAVNPIVAYVVSSLTSSAQANSPSPPGRPLITAAPPIAPRLCLKNLRRVFKWLPLSVVEDFFSITPASDTKIYAKKNGATQS